ncbi:hypothetical protein VSU19_07520 [Verrucomicrobiales bacterium BCK34]|nr:hypothetical protein [Verrucomicrobiales bacterium BCK34]
MMGPDEIGERRQVNHTPMIALGAAAVLLLIVCAMSYRDYVRTSLEKEFAEKEQRLMQRNGYYPAPQGQQNFQQQQPVLQNNSQNYAQQTNQQPVQQQVRQPQPQQPYLAPAPEGEAANSAQSSLPRPRDPEMDQLRNSMAQVKEQAARTDARYNEITGDVDRLAREAEPKASEITAELPDFLRDAVENPPGGNPDVEERLSRMRDQVRMAPALARVTGYDKDWGLVTFNAGIGQGVKKDQRFAVRRGEDILGWIKVDQVEENQSIAVLVTKNREIDTAAKPEVGDDLIDFELF